VINTVFAGGAPGQVGVAMITFTITDDLPTASAISLKIQVNGVTSNAVLLPLE